MSTGGAGREYFQAECLERYRCYKCAGLGVSEEEDRWHAAGSPRYSRKKPGGGWFQWCAVCQDIEKMFQDSSARFEAAAQEAEEQEQAVALQGTMAAAGQGLDDAVAAGGQVVSRFFAHALTAASDAVSRITAPSVDDDAVAAAVIAAELAAKQSAHKAAGKRSSRADGDASKLASQIEDYLSNDNERKLLLKVIQKEIRPCLPQVLRLRQGDGGRDDNLAIYTDADAQCFIEVRTEPVWEQLLLYVLMCRVDRHFQCLHSTFSQIHAPALGTFARQAKAGHLNK